MKGFLLLILAIIVIIIVGGGAFAHNLIQDIGADVDNIDSNPIGNIIDKISNVASSESSKDDTSSSDESIVDQVSDVVSEKIKFNAQNGEGYYREVTYKDGGFRQYDTESGDLIGSSYDSDQDKLPNME